MGKCYYKWEEWDEKTNRFIWRQCSESIWEGSSHFCIFHDPSRKKDLDLFRQRLEEKIESESKSERYCFVGYRFPEGCGSFDKREFNVDVDLRGAIFKDVYFRGAIFHGHAYFRGAIFHGHAYFNEAIFKDAYFNEAIFKDAYFNEAIFKDAYFRGAIFHGHASFNGTTFQNAYFNGTTFQNAYFNGTTFQNAYFNGTTFQNAYFNGTTFQNAYFEGAVIKEDVELVPNRVEYLNLQNAKFFFGGSITVDPTKAKFHRAYLENVSFINCNWPRKIYEEVHMKDKDVDLSFKELETIYRNLKQNMQRHGDYSQAGEFYFREMECKKKALRKKKFSPDWFKSFGYSLLKYTCGYGEKPERTAFSSLFTILGFALLYWTSECLQYPMENPTIFQKIESTIYFSFVTFTTLGLGDIHPLTRLGRTLICCEAVIGAFLIALFVVVFAKKMMR
ncbi:MAG: pentapeptide repeat-containing protein [Theionarchaea archaeon]|nr:pentapeptide repeat-containing protein [Theionarchaea archaeon]